MGIGVLSLGLASCSEARAPLPGPEHLFLITVDTLRADHVGFLGYPDQTTPFLSRLAEESAVFENAFSSASHTTPSHASLFTSLYPDQHGAVQNGTRIAKGNLTMASAMQERGYRTAGFTSVGFLTSLRTGFDHFDAHDPAKGVFRPAHETFARAAEWLADQGPEQPTFLWIHLFDVHEWDKPQPMEDAWLGQLRVQTGIEPAQRRDFFREQHGLQDGFLEAEGELQRVMDSYDRRILYVDQETERFYAAVAAMGAGADALWVLTADHGEGLYTHGYEGHGRHLYKEQLHVPLLIHSSDGLAAGQRFSNLVRHVDLLPTLAELVGQPLPPLRGRSLVSLLQGGEPEPPELSAYAQRRPITPELLADGWSPGELRVVYDLKHKFIYRSEEEGEFYDLKADPLELNNLYPSGPQALQDWQQRLNEYWNPADGPSLESDDVSEDTKDELRALGYTE